MQVVAYILKVIIPAAITIGAAFFLIRLANRGIKNLARKKDFPEANQNVLELVIKWAIGICAVLIVATIFGVKLTSLWAAVSAVIAMAAIGFFAGWSLISSALATIIIMIWQPYNVGDEIEILPDGIKGKVVDISMMFSELEDKDSNKISIPNSQMLQKIIKKLPS